MAAQIGTALIIDDETFDQRCGYRVLTRSGMVEQTICFSYAEEALDFLGQDDTPDVDLVLLDINMPRLNGFDFLERATQELSDTFAKAVVVMLTTSLSDADQARASQFTVVKDYINKPLKADHMTRLCGLMDRARDHSQQDAPQ